jgi:hypothetical protein
MLTGSVWNRLIPGGLQAFLGAGRVKRARKLQKMQKMQGLDLEDEKQGQIQQFGNG